MPDETELRVHCRDLILSGRLPNTRPERIWAGLGTGTECMVCAKPVRPDDLEFELEFASAPPGAAWTHAHLRCYHAWEGELEAHSPDLSPRPRRGTLPDRECAPSEGQEPT